LANGLRPKDNMPDPLEQFLLEYVDAVGGLADEIEPQVYDLLLPAVDQPMRLAFDPEALPEHPSAQLVTFGSALLDQILVEAQTRGRVALVYLDDVHLTPHGLDQRVRRDLVLPPHANLSVETVRPMYVTCTLFWFETTYSSDEKEQALYPVAVDRLYGRLVSYLEPLLESDRLSEIRRYPYPDASARPLEQAYLQARERLVRTVTAEANSRKHDLSAHQALQRERMIRYFADLRAELVERMEKVQARAEGTESLRSRLEALDREKTLRLEELERKATLRVQIKLMNLLHVKIPRLFLTTHLTIDEGKHAPIPLSLTWDPLVEKTDALDCPNCRHSTFELRLGRRGELRCPRCANQ
jgi:hypothetical protein